MKISLYSNEAPKGRCLLLARELAAVSDVDATSAIHAAESIFGFNHRSDNPLQMTVKDTANIAELARLCEEFGITLRT